MANLHQLLQTMIEKGASDLHITTGAPPMIRLNGHLTPVEGTPLTPTETKQLLYSVLTDTQKHRFEEENELDFSFGLKGLSRFRGNVFIQRGAVSGAIRTIPFKVQSFSDLGLPPSVQEFVKKPRGLVLVTGPTGSGKSTTLASMIDEINQSRHEHIITVEDPIEFLHPHKKCIVNQREVTSDTKSFKTALKYILRQDPDVVLIGELRDLETMEAALTLAETGHLTFGTLHTNSSAQTMNRIIDVFPAHQQPQIRAQLSMVLEGVLCQQLIPKKNGQGRIMALEVMVPTPAIRNLIREDKVHQIYSSMQTGQGQNGMQTMNQSLSKLVLEGKISLEEAMGRSDNTDELTSLMQRNRGGIPGAGTGLAEARTNLGQRNSKIRYQ
ncbi:MAG: PilT/PilU family type 4a pilus ATPase [Nitrospirae bacterium]|nr:PilT/PilU family type 4a pilus ATPase [Candidatus Manganitrophaceae bacterium]